MCLWEANAPHNDVSLRRSSPPPRLDGNHFYCPRFSSAHILGKFSTFAHSSISSTWIVWNGLQHCAVHARMCWQTTVPNLEALLSPIVTQFLLSRALNSFGCITKYSFEIISQLTSESIPKVSLKWTQVQTYSVFQVSFDFNARIVFIIFRSKHNWLSQFLQHIHCAFCANEEFPIFYCGFPSHIALSCDVTFVTHLVTTRSNSGAYFIKDLQFTLAFCGLAVSISFVDFGHFHGNARGGWPPLRFQGNEHNLPMRLKLQVFYEIGPWPYIAPICYGQDTFGAIFSDASFTISNQGWRVWQSVGASLTTHFSDFL
jgi:hypothetical protein